MDQEALVSGVLEAAGRLDLTLRDRGIHSTSASLVALDLDSSQWTLLMGLPASLSRRAIYYEIQDIIESLGLPLELDQVMLVKEGDPSLRELYGNAVNEAHGMRRENPPVEIAGRRFSEARRILATYEVFERSLLAVLRESLAEGWALHEEFRASVPALQERRSFPVIDFAVQNNDRWVLIEAKAFRRPASTQNVMEALGILTYFRYFLADDIDVTLMLIVMSGASKAARQEAQGLPGLTLIEWAPGQDAELISTALRRSLG